MSRFVDEYPGPSGYISFDLSPEQRYRIVELTRDEWAIYDRCADGDFLDFCPVIGIETYAEAKKIRERLVRGESLEDDAP